LNPDDERAVRTLISGWETAWNASDSVKFSLIMADDVEFVSILGDRYHGRDIVERGHRHIFDTIYQGSRVTCTIETIRFVRPDVALAIMHQKIVSRLPPGAIAMTSRQMQLSDKMHENEARATITLAKDRGHWHVVAVHNTGVAPKSTLRK